MQFASLKGSVNVVNNVDFRLRLELRVKKKDKVKRVVFFFFFTKSWRFFKTFDWLANDYLFRTNSPERHPSNILKCDRHSVYVVGTLLFVTDRTENSKGYPSCETAACTNVIRDTDVARLKECQVFGARLTPLPSPPANVVTFHLSDSK